VHASLKLNIISGRVFPENQTHDLWVVNAVVPQLSFKTSGDAVNLSSLCYLYPFILNVTVELIQSHQPMMLSGLSVFVFSPSGEIVLIFRERERDRDCDWGCEEGLWQTGEGNIVRRKRIGNTEFFNQDWCKCGILNKTRFVRFKNIRNEWESKWREAEHC